MDKKQRLQQLQSVRKPVASEERDRRIQQLKRLQLKLENKLKEIRERDDQATIDEPLEPPTPHFLQKEDTANFGMVHPSSSDSSDSEDNAGPDSQFSACSQESTDTYLVCTSVKMNPGEDPRVDKFYYKFGQFLKSTAEDLEQ